MGVINQIKRFFRILTEIKWKYLLYGSFVRVGRGGLFCCGKKTQIRRSRICIVSGSISIEDNCTISNVSLYINDGSFNLGSDSLLIGKSDLVINVDHGNVFVEDHCRIQCSRIWVRFHGKLSVGHYTNINSGSEIRADECVVIGKYCQISYNVHIWDTNTHVILEPSQRTKLTINHFPYFGFEESKPITKPVVINNSCWIGEGASIMKGSILNEGVIVGNNTRVIGKTIEPNTTIVEEIKLKEFPNNYQAS